MRTLAHVTTFAAGVVCGIVCAALLTANGRAEDRRDADRFDRAEMLRGMPPGGITIGRLN